MEQAATPKPETKHTPGPWALSRDVGDGEVCTVYGCTGGHIYIVGNREYLGREIEDLSAEADANARLIAAAPDLLTACKAALKYIPGSEVHSWPPGFALKDDSLKLLRAAIAKAEGGAA